MILLVDTFGREARWLLGSLKAAGLSVTPISIGYDGHLPEGVYSPYQPEEPDFVPGRKAEEKTNVGIDPGRQVESLPPEEGQRAGRPLFFDELLVPDNWEIRGTASGAEIYDYEQLRGRIYYSHPKVYRNIRIVDWLDPRGVVRSSDHYDQYGRRFATTILNESQKPILRTYFDPKGRELVVENFQTGSLVLTREGKNLFFKSPSEFVAYQIRRRAGQEGILFYNSLMTSFFTAQRLCREGSFRGVLLWQEPLEEEIPPNMQKLLKDPQGPTIIIQTAQAYERLLRMGADMSRFRRLGYIYPFERSNGGGREALIYTNTDQVESLSQLSLALPKITFHVCALTEMSSVLLALGQRENIRLYPCVTPTRAQQLLKECDFYLDINRGREILDGVERAFLNQLVILGFSDTLHEPRFVAPMNVFSKGDYLGMVRRLREAIESREVCHTLVEIQNSHALSATPEEYRAVLWEEGILDS